MVMSMKMMVALSTPSVKAVKVMEVPSPFVQPYTQADTKPEDLMVKPDVKHLDEYVL